jgi:hypothetical protein
MEPMKKRWIVVLGVTGAIVILLAILNYDANLIWPDAYG